jgi:hypothetical protein
VTDPEAVIEKLIEATPEFVYAKDRDEAQRLLDESYLAKYRAVPEAEYDALVAVAEHLRSLFGGWQGRSRQLIELLDEARRD